MKFHHKTPLPLVFGTLINIVLIILFEVLLLYRTVLPPTAELLGKADSRYENCRVYGEVNSDGNRGVRYYLVKTADGETDLVPMQQHSFFPSRAKLVKRKILQNVDQSQETTIRQILGLKIYTITISDGHISTYPSSGSFQQNTQARYLFLGLVFSLLELFLWDKLRGND